MRLVFYLSIFLLQVFLYAHGAGGETPSKTSLQPKYISAKDVKGLLTWPLVIDAVEQGLKANGRTAQDPTNQSYAVQPARTFMSYPNNSNLFMVMPSFVGNYKLNGENQEKNTLACKLVTSARANQNAKPPLPTILANILLFDEQTGELKCIMEATQITDWRTAAASIVATKYLYFKRFPEGVGKPIKLAVIGAGAQGKAHALGMCNTYNVSDVYLYNRSKSKAEKLAAELRDVFPHIRVHVYDTVEAAAREADVICMCTNSPTPVINYGMLKAGDVHVNTVGDDHEVDYDIYDNSAVYVNTKAEVKGYIPRAEIGEIIRNEKRSENQRVTLYKAMGVSATDATVAQAIYDAKMNQENGFKKLFSNILCFFKQFFSIS